MRLGRRHEQSTGRLQSDLDPNLMKSSTTIFVATFLLSLSFVLGQEIPTGVTYKRASESVNAEAKASLELALRSSDLPPPDFFGDVVVVGPLLWKALKPAADQVLLDAKPVIVMVQTPAVVAEGKRILTDNERKSFWRLFQVTYAKLKDGKVRKGNAEEISYYWATIPFDIDEPFWVVDVGEERFIADFQLKGDKPLLFWIDRVGDLRSLKP